jgi:hypothetical protein
MAAAVDWDYADMIVFIKASLELSRHPHKFGLLGRIPSQSHMARQRETIMRDRLLNSVATLAITAAAVGAVGALLGTQTSAQDPTASVAPPTAALKTSWGEPDLQGIWTSEFDTLLQRPAKYADQEFFTEAQRAELDKARSATLADVRAKHGTEADVAGTDNSVGISRKRTGARTSLIADPSNGRMPPLTPEAQKAAAAEREFRLALLQATETCKSQGAQCQGGKYDPTTSPRREELPPRYNAAGGGGAPGGPTRYNRHDGPEDGSLADRCLTAGLPGFDLPNPFGGTFRRIVQTPGGISMYIDFLFGQGWQRNIVMDGSPHLPAHIRQWYGDSRGRWEGNTLVIDVTNFSPKTDFQGSRENLHLVERWTRTGPATLEYVVTIEDPTVWTRPWTVRQEFGKQGEQENKIYYEPRCIEGNYSLPALLWGARMEELAFAEGRGPDPGTRDNATGGGQLPDPLQ